jgi:hypothetical protein
MVGPGALDDIDIELYRLRKLEATGEMVLGASRTLE